MRTSCLVSVISILLVALLTACTTPDKSGAARSDNEKPVAAAAAADDTAVAADTGESAVSVGEPGSTTPAPGEAVAISEIAAEEPATAAAGGRVELVYGDIVMVETADGMKEGEVEAVVFPHWFHRIRFRCKVCHEDTFKTDKGANEIDMDSISAGESCGMCHDGSVASDPLECETCHFYPWEQVEQDQARKEQEPENPEDILFAGRSGKVAGRGDRRNPVGSAFKWGAGWQPKALALTGLPKDKYGLVDWVELTRKGTILPKGSLDPDDPLYESPVRYEYDEDGDEDIEDILIPVKSKTLSAVVFPHTLHAWWLNCKSCHPRRFTRTAGETRMTMKEMAKGKYCGECHGKVAFPLEDCTKCHNKQKVEDCKKSDSCIS